MAASEGCYCFRCLKWQPGKTTVGKTNAIIAKNSGLNSAVNRSSVDLCTLVTRVVNVNTRRIGQRESQRRELNQTPSETVNNTTTRATPIARLGYQGWPPAH